MAEQKRSNRASRVAYHPLVEALASDPDQPKRATRLFGYPGPAAASGSTRLWLDPELTSYVDVPDDAILHHRTLESDEGTFLWVDPEATLKYSAPREQEVQAEFLGGSIAQRRLDDVPIDWEPGIPGPPNVPLDPSVIGPCPSRFMLCASLALPCPSRHRWCLRETPELNTVLFISKLPAFCIEESRWCIEDLDPQGINEQIGAFRPRRRR